MSEESHVWKAVFVFVGACVVLIGIFGWLPQLVILGTLGLVATVMYRALTLAISASTSTERLHSSPGATDIHVSTAEVENDE